MELMSRRCLPRASSCCTHAHGCFSVYTWPSFPPTIPKETSEYVGFHFKFVESFDSCMIIAEQDIAVRVYLP